MRFEYILLLILSVFPLIYKLGYWQGVFIEHKNSIKDFALYLISKQGRESCSHFWTILEIPMFMLAIVPLLNAPFEYFYYSILFYFLIIYNIFVLGKIFRKKIYLPVKNIFLLQVGGIIGAMFILPVFFPVSIYFYITGTLLFTPIVLIVTTSLNLILGKK